MARTRLTPEIELDGMSPEEAFAVLGDGTRLDIIRALWRAGALHEYDDLDTSATTIPFSELRRRVDVDDNGQFNYHLSKLTPHFVRQTDGGYRLSEAGKKIARTVIAIAGEHSPDVAEEVNTECPVCGATMTVTYDDQWLRFTCTECEGVFGDTVPEGTILQSPFPPAGLSGQTPDEALTTGIYRCMLDLTYMMQGVCRECAGSIQATISVCDDHEVADGNTCEACGSPFATWGEIRCGTCQFGKRLPIEICVMGLAPVIAFLYQQEVDVLAPSIDEIVDVLGTQFSTSVTEDPIRVRVTIDAGDDELTLTLDDEMTVLDVTS